MQNNVEDVEIMDEKQAPSLKDLLHPGRATNESQEEYKNRRRSTNMVVNNYLKHGRPIKKD